MPPRPAPSRGAPFDRFADHVGGAAAEAGRSALGAGVPAEEGLHKRDRRNVLVADLRRTGRDSWTAALVLDPGNAVLADRDNGTGHVPGMVEVEACVQMAMGVVGRDLAPGPALHVFTTSELHAEFASFLFPLPAAIALRADAVQRPRPEVLAADLTATILQSGRAVATMRFTVRAFERGHFDRVERERARAAARGFRPDLLEQP
ncbi:AfsA-related hotdog domain-containing protein [Glycomyces paridis]|uniref:A-factor biosynthesis hotdog domain-containing protein n=1 Tax=Glycomyces paridis TaxID=2126555 RepID=A0A4S8PRP5_9ACTN|nr:AfsA-related hotdog domain-containing protein [Glycomyces paridis]THV30874.1 hypothetical protein E9998_05750 [Glycomyces paridis]